MLFLDIGGEGRHANAWNVNPSPVKTLGRDRGSPIPNWIPGRASRLPFPDRVVDLVIVERTPLLRESVLEIMRVVAPDGTIILRHFHGSGSHPHQFARSTISGMCTTRTIRIGNQTLQETRFELGRVFDYVAPACQLNFAGN